MHFVLMFFLNTGKSNELNKVGFFLGPDIFYQSRTRVNIPRISTHHKHTEKMDN